ncbi:cytidylate kinase family protein [Treponema phagedenis]|uniref:cytidylate kinase family protein n=1 Tax=Treponema phagedenis TaxID=162 RepID=UPI0011EC5CDE|nr:cytidylate kinase family protein [Treponema phagedenis]TYT78142.1 phospholipid-binding protein [Treponema phagedenis]
MAIITISRQIASYGDETAAELAKLLGYEFVDRKSLEADLIKLGVPESSLQKYDEKKPTFWASLLRDRDEYFDYLREAVYEHAQKGNTIFIGRGGFALLRGIPGCYSVRLVAPEHTRVERLMNEFNWPEKKAKELMIESDTNREGFHKCFFNVVHDDPAVHHIVINTDFVDHKTAANIIKYACSQTVSAKEEEKGVEHIADLLHGQKIINHIAFDLKLPIYFLDAEVSETEIVLHGVADSASLIEQALVVANDMAKGKPVRSSISMVNEYKPYP